MNLTLSFRNTKFDITDIHGQPWLRGYQIGNALDYTDPAVAISKLFDRNADEFTDSMTQLIELPTAGGVQKVRVFSLRGCHLLGMLARTKIAKEFRRWVLDVLEKEVSGSLKPSEARTTVDERTPLRQAVSALVGLRHVDYSTAYKMIHQRFQVEAIEDLDARRIPEAVQYVHTLTLGGLQGEILDKPRPEAEPFTADEIRAFEVCVKYLHDSMAFMRCLYRPLRDVNSSMAGRAFSLSQEPHSWLDTAQNALQRHRILSRPL